MLTLARRRLTSKYLDLMLAQIHLCLIPCHQRPNPRNVIVTPKVIEHGKDGHEAIMR
jgi:hypothetical protein